MLVTAAIAAMVAVPAGAATWMSMGSHEPDNKYDSSLYQWPDAPGAETKRIYFNVWSGIAGANPNVGALQTRNEIPTLEFHQALLGMWVDCNGDGYIGMAESAVLEYDARLLLDDSICKSSTGRNDRWDGSPNYNGWVTEYVPVGGSGGDPDGPQTPQSDDVRDPRIIRDGEAAIWGDAGLPTSTAAAGGSCPIRPLPRGTLSSTGGVLNYFDCSTGLLEQWNALLRGRTIADNDVPGLDPENANGLIFENDDDARVGDHPLDVGTFGDESTDHAAVQVVDCNADPIVRLGDVLDDAVGPENTDAVLAEEDQNITVRPVNPGPTGASDPNVPGQFNQTSEEVRGDCDTSNDRGADFYGILEGDFNAVTQVGKKEADWNFAFEDFNRGDSPQNQVNRHAPTFLGLANPVNAVFFTGASWSSDSILVKTPRTVRASIADGTVGFPEPWINTFYAKVGGNTTGAGWVTPGSSAQYGALQCPTPDTTSFGWECHSELWYTNPDGTKVSEPQQGLARPNANWLYQFRDVDCYDGGNSLGVPTGTPSQSDNPCS